jgi:hypothetical protein
MQSDSQFIGSRLVVTAVSLAIVLICCFMAISSGDVMLLALPVCLLVLIALVVRPDVAFLFAMITYFTTLTFPILPQALNLSRLTTTLCVAGMLAGIVLQRRWHSDPSFSAKLIVLYGAILAVSLGMHGAGLRMLGTESWGGGEVMAQFLFVALFLLRNQLNLTAPQWKKGAVLMYLASVLPMLADLTAKLGWNSARYVYAFVSYVQSSMSETLEDAYGKSFLRLSRATDFAVGIVLLAYYLRTAGKISRTQFAALLAVGLGFLGLSGHRIGLLIVISFMTLFPVVAGYRRWSRQLLVATGVGLIAFAGLFVAVGFLPYSFQRTVAVVPFIPVADVAKRDAQGTTDWRIEVWKEALRHVPEHFWMGRGMALSPDELDQYKTMQFYNASMGRQMSNVEEALIMHDYHNGPISLLLDLGVLGLGLCVTIMVVLCVEGIWNSRRRKWNNKDLATLYAVFLTSLITGVIIFLTTYGDVRTMMQFLFLGTLLAGIRNCDARIPVPDAAADERQRARLPSAMMAHQARNE